MKATTPKKEVMKPTRMWAPPAGWWKAAQEARREREESEFRAADNMRRAQYGLPTYGL